MRYAPWALDGVLQASSVLLYGSDVGLIFFLYEMARQKLQGRFLRLDEAAFIGDPRAVLEPDLFTRSEEPRLVVVEEVTDKSWRVYQDIVQAPLPPGVRLFLTSLKLRAASPLVKFFQTESLLGAVACYPLEFQDRLKLMRAYVMQAGYQVTQEGLEFLAHTVESSELWSVFQKLRLLPHGLPFTLESLESCVTSNSGQETLVHSVIFRHLDAIATIFSSYTESGELLGFLRQLMRYSMRLLQVRTAIERGIPVTQALEQLSPPLFFKDAPHFRKALDLWTCSQLYDLLQWLFSAEITVKQGIVPEACFAQLQSCMEGA